MHDITCGSFVEGELYPLWMQFFPRPFCLYSFLYLLFLLLFLFIQGLTRGHCLDVVTRVDSVTHKYFHSDDKAGS
jgi:hypothetical protein